MHELDGGVHEDEDVQEDVQSVGHDAGEQACGHGVTTAGTQMKQDLHIHENRDTVPM